MNTVQLIGRLTKDATFTPEQGNRSAVARFNLAVTRDKDNADYPGIVAFGKTAEIINKYTKKGSQIGITGEIRTVSYEKDGQKVYTTNVIANRVFLLGSKTNAEEPTTAEPTAAQTYPGFTEAADLPF